MKYNISTIYNMNILSVKTQKNDVVVNNEILWINSQRIPGLVPVDIEQKGNISILNYNVTGFIPIKKYLKKKITRSDFIALFKSFIICMEQLQNNGLDSHKLLADDKAIFINPVSKKCEFIFIPVDTYNNGKILSKFVKEITHLIHIEKVDDTGYMKNLDIIIGQNDYLNWQELSAFIKQLEREEMAKFSQIRNTPPMMQKPPVIPQQMNGMQQAPIPPQQMNGMQQPPVIPQQMNGMQQAPIPPQQMNGMQQAPIPPQQINGVSQNLPEHESRFCAKCGCKNSSVARFCKQCGMKLDFVEEVAATVEMNFNTGIPMQPTYTDAYDEQEAETSVLRRFEEADEATTVLCEVKPRIYPYLLRENTQEKIQINKDEFIIGKGKASDYMIVGNNAISRNHITVISRNDSYFVIDNHSTNYTYINNEQIQPEQEYEITFGAKIRLADEEFTFCIEDM